MATPILPTLPTDWSKISGNAALAYRKRIIAEAGICLWWQHHGIPQNPPHAYPDAVKFLQSTAAKIVVEYYCRTRGVLPIKIFDAKGFVREAFVAEFLTTFNPKR